MQYLTVLKSIAAVKNVFLQHFQFLFSAEKCTQSGKVVAREAFQTQ